MDLRAWLQEVERIGELRVVRGADWNLEIGAITEYAVKHRTIRPAVLFDEIQGYPAGYRVLSGLLNTPGRMALTLGLPPAADDAMFISQWRQHVNTLQPVAPRFVSDGPVLENVLEGDDIDLWRFPTPKWNDLDGGRYIGTADAVVTTDPETGRVNLGAYRAQVHDKNIMTVAISYGKHGRIHQDQFLNSGKPFPIAVVAGAHPLLFQCATTAVTHRQGGFESELHLAGAIQNRPVDVFRGKYTGLPLPADAEIIIEGEMTTSDTRREGPFGEWTGYYASGARPLPIVNVKAIYHRKNPIMTGVCVTRMPTDYTHGSELIRAVQIWNQLEGAGLTDVTGVACYQNRLIVAVSIKQRYAGHAKQAAALASQCRAGANLGRYVIVVDDDINVHDLNEVLWAFSTRVDPVKDIEIIRDCWSTALDPIIPQEEWGLNSRALITATKPYKWRDQFPASTVIRADVAARVKAKWHDLDFIG